MLPGGAIVPILARFLALRVSCRCCTIQSNNRHAGHCYPHRCSNRELRVGKKRLGACSRPAISDVSINRAHARTSSNLILVAFAGARLSSCDLHWSRSALPRYLPPSSDRAITTLSKPRSGRESAETARIMPGRPTCHAR